MWASTLSAGGLSPNTEVSGGKVTQRSLQLGGQRNVKVPRMQVAKGSVIHASDAPLWKRWKEYQERAGYGKALKWLALNVLELAYSVWEHRVPCDPNAHFGLGKPKPEPLAIAAPVEPVVVSVIRRAPRKCSPSEGHPPQPPDRRSAHNKRRLRPATWPMAYASSRLRQTIGWRRGCRYQRMSGPAGRLRWTNTPTS